VASSQLERISQGFVGRLTGAEQKALAETARAYRIAAKRLVPLWQDAYRALQYAKAQGFDDSYLTGFIWREQRMAKLLADMGAIFEQVGQTTGVALTSGQQEAIALAEQSFAASMAAASATSVGEVMGTLGISFPRAAFERMVGSLTDGSPITSLAQRYGDTGPKVIRQALLEGVANGDNPKVVARRIHKALGKHYGNTTLLTRTEMLRVYRETIRGTYQANAKYVQGWIWNSALDRRTCPVCYAMHGTKHSLGEPMATHPACRCSMIPWLRPSPLINALPEGQLGTDAFRALPSAAQEAILGPMAFKAYSRGMFDLPDLVAVTYNPTWGAGRRQRSLASVLGPQRLAQLA
jgi:SPP1 gp7 family putative phage head morphogenesis protein